MIRRSYIAPLVTITLGVLSIVAGVLWLMFTI